MFSADDNRKSVAEIRLAMSFLISTNQILAVFFFITVSKKHCVLWADHAVSIGPLSYARTTPCFALTIVENNYIERE
jgi:hypothetical protein